MDNVLEVALNFDHIEESFRPGPVTYYYGYYTILPYIVGIIAIASIIISILKHNKKNIIISLVIGIVGLIIYNIGKDRAWSTTPMLGGGGPTTIYVQYPVISKILFIISIIIQLIPFIICLRKNKNVKKDEVKQ